MSRSLPADIEVLVNDDGAYIELESFIRFLRSDENVPEEYKPEAKHLKKIAEYLESELGDLLAQKKLISEVFNTDIPN